MYHYDCFFILRTCLLPLFSIVLRWFICRSSQSALWICNTSGECVCSPTGSELNPSESHILFKLLDPGFSGHVLINTTSLFMVLQWKSNSFLDYGQDISVFMISDPFPSLCISFIQIYPPFPCNENAFVNRQGKCQRGMTLFQPLWPILCLWKTKGGRAVAQGNVCFLFKRTEVSLFAHSGISFLQWLCHRISPHFTIVLH